MRTAKRRCALRLSCLLLGFALLLAATTCDEVSAATWEISAETLAAIDALPAADQELIKKDIEAVKHSCRPGTAASSYQNCSCIVVHFVDERLKDMTSNWGDVTLRAMVAMGATCRDEAAVRAHFTARCEDRQARQYSFVDEAIRSEFCACYGNQLAERFMASPPDVHRVGQNVMVDANLACDHARFIRLSRERHRSQQAK